ncbi:hypothetical protein [Blastococcus sp. TF02A-26]|uniref:hypothetical protein n=1 Tax=Blastococcus sp. TF02A-26 TaxID=2250577 RepID=UPI000DE9676F|nr:hypothetical protein [Blastococcus sp. TF02A-26]RBY90620.1 hypothetical protein DQ240_00625 [Blastococcus sp. TF02A-26]
MDITALITAEPQPLALVDVDDLEDGDLAARLAEIAMPAVAAPRRIGYLPVAERQAGVDAVLAARAVVRDGGDAVSAHRLGAGAAALVA